MFKSRPRPVLSELKGCDTLLQLLRWWLAIHISGDPETKKSYDLLTWAIYIKITNRYSENLALIWIHSVVWDFSYEFWIIVEIN